MGYGVIGNTTVSGTVVLGSSPGIPAKDDAESIGSEVTIGLPMSKLMREKCARIFHNFIWSHSETVGSDAITSRVG